MQIRRTTVQIVLSVLTGVALLKACFCFTVPPYFCPSKTCRRRRPFHESHDSDSAFQYHRQRRRRRRRLDLGASPPSDNDDEDARDDGDSFTETNLSPSSSAVLLSPFDEVSCPPPSYEQQEQQQAATQQQQQQQPKTIFIISDATGVTAKAALSKCLIQFDTCDPDIYENCDVHTRMFTFIRSEPTLRSILEKAAEKQACVVFTLADPVLRQCATQHCQTLGLGRYCIDLVGPTLQILADFLQQEPLGVPLTFRPTPNTKRRAHAFALGDSYYRRIEAVEFTLKADDGQSPWLLPEADVVLVGVSRSGKTPLSVVLAQTMGLKVANVPLVMECPPPAELVSTTTTTSTTTSPRIDPNRVFCLTLAPSELRRIRSSRLERRNVREMERKYNVDISTTTTTTTTTESFNSYADRAYVLKDLKHARALATQHGWTEIDVTGRAVEETASLIVQYLNERQDDGIDSILLSAKHLT